MWEWLAGLSSLSIFLAIGALGFLFLLVSFFFSEYLEAIELGDGVEVEMEGGPSVFSLRTLSIFLTGLGGLGAMAQLRGASTALSVAVGLMGGAALAGVVYGFVLYLYRQQSSSLVATDELIGRAAEVIVGIPAAGVGQVRCQVGEMMMEKIARARDDSAIPAGTPVCIEEIVGQTAIVSPWKPLEAGRSLFPLPEAEAQTDAPGLPESTRH